MPDYIDKLNNIYNGTGDNASGIGYDGLVVTSTTIIEGGSTVDLFVVDWVDDEDKSFFKQSDDRIEEIQQYRRYMLDIDRRYEGTKKSIRSKHYNRDMHRYYHLYKHRSF